MYLSNTLLEIFLRLKLCERKKGRGIEEWCRRGGGFAHNFPRLGILLSLARYVGGSEAGGIETLQTEGAQRCKFLRGRTLVPVDLNIKGGLNQTYTTLNHVTYRLIRDLPNTISRRAGFSFLLTEALTSDKGLATENSHDNRLLEF